MSSADSSPLQGRLVYTPPHPERTRIDAFRRKVAQKKTVELNDYDALWKWSCEHVEEFWEEVWGEVDVLSSRKWDKVLDPPTALPSDLPSWFLGARLNFAENLLRCRSPDKVAVIESVESTTPFASSDAAGGSFSRSDQHLSPHGAKPLPWERSITYAQLYSLVSRAARSLRSLGIGPHDVVASYTSNCASNLVAFLATSSLGAIWSSAAADFGPAGVLERFSQIRPKVVFGSEKVRYNGKEWTHVGKLAEVEKGLKKAGAKPLKIVVMPMLGEETEGGKREGWQADWVAWDDFLGGEADGEKEIEFYQAPFDHPLWILFSSGTTGKPKPIIHRAGGMLLQTAKEHAIHGDLTANDVLFYFTTTGWMMWNWLISALFQSCTIVLFDGSPLNSPSVLWDLAERHGVTVFGTSAKFLDAVERSGYRPGEKHDLHKIRQILSTGSPLKATLYPFILDAISPHILIGSITGGTDICSLFCSHNASLPVRAGELQCRALGMAVDAFTDEGKPAPLVTSPEGVEWKEGELVCTKPFPVQPLGFWGDEKGERYRESYYSQVPGVWYHGDHIAITQNGGVVMLGRSDGVLNPGGIRFGSAEIYELLEAAAADASSPLASLEDSLVVALKTPAGDDEVVVLFLQLKSRALSGMTDAGWEKLVGEIKMLIRKERSARHVPKFVERVGDVPATINGKKVEVPVKKLINGASISSLNLATLKNPECLEEYSRLGEKLRKEIGRVGQDSSFQRRM